jgi:hypothetical protein
LRGAAGPGVELLQYLMPRDGWPIPADTTADDMWAEKIVFGHAVGYVADAREISR